MWKGEIDFPLFCAQANSIISYSITKLPMPRKQKQKQKHTHTQSQKLVRHVSMNQTMRFFNISDEDNNDDDHYFLLHWNTWGKHQRKQSKWQRIPSWTQKNPILYNTTLIPYDTSYILIEETTVWITHTRIIPPPFYRVTLCHAIYISHIQHTTKTPQFLLNSFRVCSMCFLRFFVSLLDFETLSTYLFLCNIIFHSHCISKLYFLFSASLNLFSFFPMSFNLLPISIVFFPVAFIFEFLYFTHILPICLSRLFVFCFFFIFSILFLVSRFSFLNIRFSYLGPRFPSISTDFLHLAGFCIFSSFGFIYLVFLDHLSRFCLSLLSNLLRFLICGQCTIGVSLSLSFPIEITIHRDNFHIYRIVMVDFVQTISECVIPEKTIWRKWFVMHIMSTQSQSQIKKHLFFPQCLKLTHIHVSIVLNMYFRLLDLPI